MANKYTANPKDVKNFTQSSEISIPQSIQDYSEFLPAINRTESLTRFFGSTVNQLLSSGSTQSIDSYWGRLSGKNYNADQDRFMEEASANRLNYQYQPGVVSRSGGDVQSTTSYINWLNRIESLGADLDNHDRLFSEPGYVLDFPINADMFTNYNNYYWLEGDIPLIVIDATADDPINIDDIVALSNYTTPILNVNFKQFEFVSGLRIKFTGDNITSTSGNYFLDYTYYVENVGGRGGIKLLAIEDDLGNDLFPSITPYEVEIKEGWDTETFDTTAWDGPGAFDEYSTATTVSREDLDLNKSYIVMERWATDKNPWARSNKWFSIHALTIATDYNDLDLEAYRNNRTRASRPIIEFLANMELFNFCKNYVEQVDYVITIEQVTDILSGAPSYLVDPNNGLQNGDIILVAEDGAGGIDLGDYNIDYNPDFDIGQAQGAFGSAFGPAYEVGAQVGFYKDAYTVTGVGTAINLVEYATYANDDYIIVRKGDDKGAIWCKENGEWGRSQNKETRATPPLFNLYDENQKALLTYNENDFYGDKIFGYKESETGPLDRELGLAPTFTKANTFSDWEFEWVLNNNRYSKDIEIDFAQEIPGYYYWYDCVEQEYFNGWSNIRGGQRVPIVQTHVADGVNNPTFDLGTEAIKRPTEFTVTLEDGKYHWYEHSYIDRTPVGYDNPELIWTEETDYTIHTLISDPAEMIEFVDPYGNVDPSFTVTTVGTVTTIRISSAYAYTTFRYRSQTNPTTLYGEIHLSNYNTNRLQIRKNGQIMVKDIDAIQTQGPFSVAFARSYDSGVVESVYDIDYTITGNILEITSPCADNDVIELMYTADADLTNVVYDVAPVHFYNSQNRPYVGGGYAEIYQHFDRQLAALPGFTGTTVGLNNYHKILRQQTHDGIIRQQIFNTPKIQYLLDQEDVNPIRALKSFSKDYALFKKYFKNKVNQLWRTNSYTSIRDLVDAALNDINLGKNQDFKYAHSDMAYSKQYRETTYSIANAVVSYILPNVINKFGHTQNHLQVWLKEYDGVSQYLERPLVKGVDYNINGNKIVLTSAVTLNGTLDPATLTVRWFDYTQISHIPFSTVKLGFFRPTQVEVVDGELVGHDGSRHTVTGTEYQDMNSSDFDVVTAALLDYELRVFNNLVSEHFVSAGFGFDMGEMYPNPHGEFAYTVSDINLRLDDWYNRYAVREGLTEIDLIDYDAGDEFTWNYSTVGPNLGSWRSLYMYYFGTDRPHTHPWEMLGHRVKPTWWDATYSWAAGAQRTALLAALKYGVTGNNTTASFVNVKYARNQYDWDNDTLVTTAGVLNGPVTANVVASPTSIAASKDFVFGDWSEIENEWRKSSEYGFAFAEALLQLKPYRTHELFWSLGRWRLNKSVTQDQWIDDGTCDRTHNDEIHNQLITAGVISEIKVKNPGTGYSYLYINFSPDSVCEENASATTYQLNGQIINVAVNNPGRGYNKTPKYTLVGSPGGSGAEIEFLFDFNFYPTHLGFNTLPAEEFTPDSTDSTDLAVALANLEVGYMLHVGGFTDKRILALEVDGDFNEGKVRVPESNYSINIDRNAPIKIAHYSGVKIEKVTNQGYRVDGYNLDSAYFNYLRPSSGGKNIAERIGTTTVTRYLNWRNEVSRLPYRSLIQKRQELYTFLLGLGEYYESIGFLANTEWQADARAAIEWALSDDTEPFYVNGITDTLTYSQGDQGRVQTVDVNYDGVFNVLDSDIKNIKRSDMLVLRNDTTTEYSLKSGADRIYGLGVRVVEFEHIITLDNVSKFNDELYKPESGIGQNRIKVIGERTRNWNGRVEAPGYIVNNNGLILNMESSVRELERDWINVETKALERLTRQTAGYNVGYSKPTYMKDTFVSDTSAYRFEIGRRKYKGTESAFEAMTRNKNIFGTEFEHEHYEEWMVRLGDYGDKSERNPLQFAVVPDKIKNDPQQFRFDENFISDRTDDLIIDIHDGSKDAISGDFKSPFAIYDVLRLDNDKIQLLDQYQTFTRNAGLPLVDEIDYFLGSIDDIGTIYDPTQPYALVPNWSETAAYAVDDTVRRYGKVYKLNIASTGLTGLADDIIVRGSQVYPSVANDLTFIANGETVTFSKQSTSTSSDTISVTGTEDFPIISYGETLILDGVTITFNSFQTLTGWADIELLGSTVNPTITNSATKTVTISFANSASPTALTDIIVSFNEIGTTLTMQQVWLAALTSAGASDAANKASARIAALEALRSAYVAATNVATWEAFINGYYSALTPNYYVNPEYLGIAVAGSPGASWETAARALIQIDLALLNDIGGTNTLLEADMVSGRGSWSAPEIAAFDADMVTVNNLLDFNVTANNSTENLQGFRTFVEGNGGSSISTGTEITVANPGYVTDDLTAIITKINDRIDDTFPGIGLAAEAGGASLNQLQIVRINNTNGYRLGVDESTPKALGFTGAQKDVETTGEDLSGPIASDLSAAIDIINAASVTGVSASASSNKLRLQSVNETLTIGNSTSLNGFGLVQGAFNANITTTITDVDLAIGDVVSQINAADITNLTASSVGGALLITYSGTTLTIGAGTANSVIGLAEQSITSQTEAIQNEFVESDWTIIQDPAHFNIWTIDNIGSNPEPQTTTNRYDVYQTLDFQIGVIEVCAGNENGDDALIECDTEHTLSSNDYVLIVNSTCVPSIDGIHQVTGVSNDYKFFIDRYIEEKGYTGKVFPLRSVRFPSNVEATAALSNTDYINGALGLRDTDVIYVDEVLDDQLNSLGYGAVYTVSRTLLGNELSLVRIETGKTNNSIIKNGQLYSEESNTTVLNFEVFDPLKGIIPGIADKEIDYRTDIDVAYYNNSTDPDFEIRESNSWGKAMVGDVWWDLSNAIYLNYDQGSDEYRQKHWAELFPTATIDVYEWTKSPVTPDEYLSAVNAGTVIDGIELTGMPYVITDQYGETQYNWSEEIEVNPNTNQLETYYYFWVSNKTTVPNTERSYSTLQLSEILSDPTSQDINWIAATGTNSLLVSSLDKATSFADLIMQVNFDTNPSDYHQEYELIAENDPTTVISEWLHMSLRDSLAGYTQIEDIYNYNTWNSISSYAIGNVVLASNGNYYKAYTASVNIDPATDFSAGDYWSLLDLYADNPDGDYSGGNTMKVNIQRNIPDLRLHPSIRYGLETRPHQTWFKELERAREVLVDKLNSQFKEINLIDSIIPWRDELDRTFQVGGLSYDLTQYWNLIDWVLDDTIITDRGVGDAFVNTVAELATLTPVEGMLAHVETSADYDGTNRRQIYKYSDGEWILVFKEKATIEFSDLLWDNSQALTGWDIAAWDTTEWDQSSSAAMAEIFDVFYNKLWIGEYRTLYNDIWFHMVKHVHHEQREVDWIFKSSYIKFIAEDKLEKQYNKYFDANIDELFDYINNVKPFRSKIRDAIIRKTADDEFSMTPKDALELRVQTNIVGSTIDELTTRSFRLTVGHDGLHHSSQIVNEHKKLLAINVGPEDTVIPVISVGSTTFPAPTGAFWLNGERIEYSGFDTPPFNKIGGGFSSGYDAGYGGVLLLLNAARGTQGTFAREHYFADVMEDETNLTLATPTVLSDNGNDITPAWNTLGEGLLDDPTNQDPNGITIQNEAFGTITLYGELQVVQWYVLDSYPEAIEGLANELEELIEFYWPNI